MADRPSWYTCSVCGVPYTSERPLVRVHIKNAPRAFWEIHPECKPALEAELIPGTELVCHAEVANV